LNRRHAILGSLAAAAALAVSESIPASANARQMQPVSSDTPKGRALVDKVRGGGFVLFFRHADTMGEPCDRSFKVGDRKGQRNISPRGREQSRRIGEAFDKLGIPVGHPVLAGPVYRARDTAELAFGKDAVEVTDSLLADDYSGPRLRWVLDEHLRLFNSLVPARINQVMVGHRTPAIMVLGEAVGGRAFPEGAALVLEAQAPGSLPRIHGILELAPLPGGGFHSC
jgi:phosphohistidine phosphatase SixA